MKIAIVTETFPPEVNGVAMTFGIIVRELARRGHEVTVYRPWRDDLVRGESPVGYATVTLPGFPVPGYSLLRMGWPAAARLTRAWSGARPDLVHVVTEGPLGASAVRAARTLGIPVTSSFHTNFHTYTSDYGFALLQRPVFAWLRHVHNRTLRTFVPTREILDALASNGFERLALLSRGVDTWQFHPSRRSPELRLRWGADSERPVVLHVGRMAAEKNYELLFAAYKAMAAANPELRFVLAGEGPLRARLQREHPECVFVGFLSRQEIGRYFASADIYVHASLSETFGNVLTEALASGMAVVSFDYAAGRQFIEHGKSGLLAPCSNPAGFLDAAVMLATDPLLRAQLRSAARDAVAAQSWENVIGEFERALAEIAGAAQANVRETAAPALTDGRADAATSL